jgi:hypothetical protein
MKTSNNGLGVGGGGVTICLLGTLQMQLAELSCFGTSTARLKVGQLSQG